MPLLVLTMSSTASSNDVKHATATGEAQSLEPVNEYEDAEKNFQPKSIKFWSIMIGMYLSFFLVGLVSNVSCYPPFQLTRDLLDRIE